MPEMVRKAFKVAQTERPGSCYLGVPQDLEEMSVSPTVRPLLRSEVYDSALSIAGLSTAKVLRQQSLLSSLQVMALHERTLRMH